MAAGNDAVASAPTVSTPAVQWSLGVKAISWAVGVLLAAVLLYYSLHGIEWRQVARIVAGASPERLGLAAAMGTATLFLRACRWRILLNADGAISVSMAFWAVAAGYFGNNYLPLRAGELVRTFMISSRSVLSQTYVLATALSERVADAVALVVITSVVLLMLPAQSGWIAGAARPFALLGLLGALVIAVLPRLESLVGTAIERAPMPRAFRLTLTAAVEQGLRGMRTLHDARRLSGFVGLTVLIWSLDALGTVIAGTALGFRIPISAAFLLLAGLGLGSALPSTPGYVGIYQFVAVMVLTPFGFSRTDAVAYILVAQALTYVLIGFWGSLALWRFRRSGLGPGAAPL